MPMQSTNNALLLRLFGCHEGNLRVAKKKSISAQFSLVGSEARKLKDTIRNALNKAVGGKSFSDAQDSTSCLTALLHFKDTSSADELKKSGLWQEV